MVTQLRQSWSRKPGCWRRMSGSYAETPRAAAGLWLLMDMMWPKPHQNQNVPIRTRQTEAKGPSSARSFLQLMAIHSQGKKVRAEQMNTLPCLFSQLLLGRDSQWGSQSLQAFCFSFLSSENKCSNWLITMDLENAGKKIWLYSSQSLWSLYVNVLQFGVELENLHWTAH